MEWIIKSDENQQQEDTYIAGCQHGMTGSCSGSCCGSQSWGASNTVSATPDNLKLW